MVDDSKCIRSDVYLSGTVPASSIWSSMTSYLSPSKERKGKRVTNDKDMWIVVDVADGLEQRVKQWIERRNWDERIIVLRDFCEMLGIAWNKGVDSDKFIIELLTVKFKSVVWDLDGAKWIGFPAGKESSLSLGIEELRAVSSLQTTVSSLEARIESLERDEMHWREKARHVGPSSITCLKIAKCCQAARKEREIQCLRMHETLMHIHQAVNHKLVVDALETGRDSLVRLQKEADRERVGAVMDDLRELNQNAEELLDELAPDGTAWDEAALEAELEALVREENDDLVARLQSLSVPASASNLPETSGTEKQEEEEEEQTASASKSPSNRRTNDANMERGKLLKNSTSPTLQPAIFN